MVKSCGADTNEVLNLCFSFLAQSKHSRGNSRTLTEVIWLLATCVIHLHGALDGRRAPGHGGGCDVAALCLRLHPLAERRASRAGALLALAPDGGQQQRAEPVLQRCGAVGGVRVEHGVVAAVDVRVVDVRVGAGGLRVEPVGPGVRDGRRRRRQVALREHVVGPQSSVWMVEGNGAGGEVRVDRDGPEAGCGLGRVGAAPRRAALGVGERRAV